MKSLLIFALLVICSGSRASDKKYPISEIPDSLLKGANAVIRTSEEKVFINSLNSVTYRIHLAVTILNEKGDSYAALKADYDKLQKVSDISGAMYDTYGNMIEKLKGKDIEDISDLGGVNWEDDNRSKVYHFSNTRYPFTVEFSYELNISHTFFFPSWMPQTDELAAVQNSEFEVNFPRDFGIRYELINSSDPEKNEEKGREILRWRIANRPAAKIIKNFSSWNDYRIAVLIAPSDFRLGQINGNMESWRNFGSFVYQLIKGKDILPDAIKAKVHELVSNAHSDKEKIDKLYEFFQRSTRYVSVQLGIGGWEPYNAAYVAGKGYGDCKALANYMQSLLKEAGIVSYYTLVYAGDNSNARNRVIESFPSQQFNHVILCIPSARDTTWLECTSQMLPAGYVGGFTANRKALMIREDGGFLVSTPRYNVNENKLIRKTKVKIARDGSAEIYSETTYTGLQQDDLFGMIKSISPEKIKRFLSNAISLPSYELKDFTYEESPSELPEIKERLDIAATSYAHVTGKRIFITPNIFSRTGLNIEMDTTRLIPFTFSNAYHDADLIEIEFPAGYQIEASVKPVSISSSFGKYEMSCDIEGNKIVYRRLMEQYQTKVPVSKQAEVVDFYKQVYKVDRARIVLVSKED